VLTRPARGRARTKLGDARDLLGAREAALHRQQRQELERARDLGGGLELVVALEEEWVRHQWAYQSLPHVANRSWAK
jgi:hypothetical protein